MTEIYCNFIRRIDKETNTGVFLDIKTKAIDKISPLTHSISKSQPAKAQTPPIEEVKHTLIVLTWMDATSVLDFILHMAT